MKVIHWSESFEPLTQTLTGITSILFLGSFTRGCFLCHWVWLYTNLDDCIHCPTWLNDGPCVWLPSWLLVHMLAWNFYYLHDSMTASPPGRKRYWSMAIIIIVIIINTPFTLFSSMTVMHGNLHMNNKLHARWSIAKMTHLTWKYIVQYKASKDVSRDFFFFLCLIVNHESNQQKKTFASHSLYRISDHGCTYRIW